MQKSNDREHTGAGVGDSGVARIDAIDMWNASKNDPEMAIPAYPAFLPGASISIIENVLVVDGGASRQILNGKAASTLVPRLIELLDGTRTIADVAHQLGFPNDQVEAAVALMATCGLIVPSLSSPEHFSTELSSVIARHLDTTKRWSSVLDAWKFVQGTPAFIVDTGSEARRIVEVLTSSGDEAKLVSSPLDVNDAGDLVIFGPNSCLISKAMDFLERTDGNVRLCGIRDGKVWIGPSYGELAPCLECQARALTDQSLLGDIEEGDLAMPLGIALIGLELYHERMGIGQPMASNSLLVHDLTSGSTSQYFVPRTPGCKACGIEGESLQAPWPYIYDQAAAFPPRNQVAMKGHQMHYKPSNVMLQWARREFKFARQFNFSSGDDWQNPSDARTRLGALMRYGFGLRQLGEISRVQRFAPTGGNLGSPEGIILVRNVKTIAQGAYYYLPFEDEFAFLGDLPDEWIESAFASTDFDAILLITSSLGRVEKKYHSLAFRICLLDAGVAVSQVKHAAGDMGIEVSVIENWDDQMLTDQFSNGELHPIMAVLGLRGLDG